MVQGETANLQEYVAESFVDEPEIVRQRVCYLRRRRYASHRYRTVYEDHSRSKDYPCSGAAKALKTLSMVCPFSDLFSQDEHA